MTIVELGDGIAGLSSTSDAALVLTDLPSGETQAEFDCMPDLNAFWPAVWGALKKDGVTVVMASNIRFAAIVVASQPAAFRYDLIWHKSLAVGFLNAKRRPLRAHEFVLVFSRTANGTYHPQMRQGLAPIHANRERRATGENYGPARGGRSRAGATTRYPWSVLPFASVGTTDAARVHPQQKPVDLLRYLIRTYSSPGDLVLDPFAGSGSTGAAARAEGRRFRGWDYNPRFANKDGASQKRGVVMPNTKSQIRKAGERR